MSDAATAASAVATAAALALLGGAWLLALLGRREEERARVRARFLSAAGHSAAVIASATLEQRSRFLQWLERWLSLAGLAPTRRLTMTALQALVASLLLGALLRGWVGLAVAPLLTAGAGVAVVSALTRRRRQLVLAQLPGFLDHMARAVGTGRSLQQALAAASEEAPDPTREIFQRARRQVFLGASLEDALDTAVAPYRLRELDLLALTVRTNQRFGGSVRDILASIVAMIQQRDRARREFQALTGETRLSAWILGALPMAVALYVVTVNPDYIQRMWNDPTGSNVLIFSMCLQALGVFVLWRMVRSV